MNRLRTNNRWPVFSVESEIQQISDFTSRNSPPYPDGVFLVPLCVTAKQLTALLSAAWFGAELVYPDESINTILPLLQATEYIDAPFEAVCLDMIDRRYRITDDCLFQESTDGENWTTLRDLSALECLTGDGSNGRTPQLRSVEIDDNTYRIDWKYTDESENAWRPLVTVSDGENGRTPQMRAVTVDDDSRRIDWKYTDENADEWRALVTVSDGEDAPTPQFRVQDCQLQYRLGTSGTWTTLYNLANDPCGDDDDRDVTPPPQSGVGDANRCNASVKLLEWLERTLIDILNAKDAGIDPTDNAIDIWEGLLSRRLRNLARRVPIVGWIEGVIDGSQDVELVEASMTLARREELVCVLYCANSDTLTDDMISSLKAKADEIGYGEANAGNEFAGLIDALGSGELRDRWNMYLRSSDASSCADCECEEETWTYTFGLGGNTAWTGWEIYNGGWPNLGLNNAPGGVITGGIVEGLPGAFGYTRVTIDLPFVLNVGSSIETITGNGQIFGSEPGWVNIQLGTGNGNGNGLSLQQTITGSGTIRIHLHSFNGPCQLNSVTFTGTGDNPFL